MSHNTVCDCISDFKTCIKSTEMNPLTDSLSSLWELHECWPVSAGVSDSAELYWTVMVKLQFALDSQKSEEIFINSLWGYVSLSNGRSSTHKVSPAWLSNSKLNKDDTDKHAKVNEGKTHEVSTLHKNYRQLRNSGSGASSLPRDKHSSWLPKPNGKSWKHIYKWNIILTEQVIFRNVYACACTHTHT